MKTYKLNELMSIDIDAWTEGISNAYVKLHIHAIFDIPCGECPAEYEKEITDLANKAKMRFDNLGQLVSWDLSPITKERLSKKN